MATTDQTGSLHDKLQQRMNQLQQGLQNTTHLLAPMGLPNPHKAFRQPSKYTWSPDTTTSSSTIDQKDDHIEYRQGIVIPLQVPRRHLEYPEEWLWETLLPLYNLLAMFGWNHPEDPPADSTKMNLQLVLLEGGGSHETDEDQDMWCNATCIQPLQQLFQQWMGYSLLSLNQQESVDDHTASTTTTTTSTICWSHAAAGMGLLSAKGLSQQGHHSKDYSPFRIHNVGKGNLFWQLRQHIVRRQKTMEDQQGEDGLGGATRHRVWAMPPGKGPSPPTSTSLTIIPPLAWSNTTHLLHIATQSQLWVALANETSRTWPAFFMPSGSTLVLLYDETTRPQGSPRDSHPTMVQFDVWNHVTHLKVHWVALQHQSSDLVAWLNALVPSSNSAASVTSVSVARDSELPVRVPPANISPTFHGHQLSWRPPQPSSAHCIGHNWEWDSHNYHSCRIQNMCWNTQTQTFHITTNGNNSILNDRTLAWRPWDVHSTHAKNQQVMMGQTVRLGSGEPWFPSLSYDVLHESAVAWLPKDVVWMPYFAQVPNSNNPGHLLWDYFFPFFVLVDLFMPSHTSTKNTSLLLTHLDSDCVAPSACNGLTRKFLPLLGVDPASFGNPRHQGDDSTLPTWICSHETLVGIGMLTDHGFKKHGQLLEDYQNVWNVGRGVSFWRFRNFLWDQFTQKHPTAIPPLERPVPFRITFSINSSVNPSRRRDFATHIEQLQTTLEHEPTVGEDYLVTPVELAKHSMAEQLQLMNETAIFVSVVGGSASTATLLNRNAVVILFYNDIDDWVKTKPHERRSRQAMPAMLDWDFWNHASYLRVHWLPISTMEERDGIETFVELVRKELGSMAVFTSGP